MDGKEFEDEVRAAAPQLARKALDMAISHHVDHWPRLDRAAVRGCIQLAGLLDQSFPNVARTSTATQAVALPPPAAAIGSHQLALKILPQIQEIRQKFFARADPPFSSWADAEGWLRGAKNHEPFEEACQALAGAKGFAQSEVKRYVLVGFEPYLSHVEVTIQSRAYATHGQINFYWSFTDKDVRMATREVRKALGVSRLKGLTDRDQRLLRLIQQVGAPPSISNKACWQQILALWNADPGNEPCPAWRALEMQYKRLLEKLRRLPPSHQATPTR